jgi:NADPH2 dehydrogenase
MARNHGYPRISTLNSPEKFRTHLDQLGLDMGFDEELESGSDSALSKPLTCGEHLIGNRFCVLPMEGWDGTRDGRPTELTTRRWKNFGRSGAKLIWGGEAVAVQTDGRANPNQLLMCQANLSSLENLRHALVKTHSERFHSTSDLLVGLQLTHSGRFARPSESAKLEPRILFHHRQLDKKFGTPPDLPCLNDSEIQKLVDRFIQAAVWASQIGFSFVDIKHCHGYLGHEFLNAVTRRGPYGGSFENRTRFLREIVAGIRAEAPSLEIGVRLSAFDMPMYVADETGKGIPMAPAKEDFMFGALAENSRNWTEIQLPEVEQLMRFFESLDIRLVCLSGGSPYYNPHIQRPALFPPSDGYTPPEDPLVGVNRHIQVTRWLKKRFPDVVLVGSGYSYLQDWLPHVAQREVRKGAVDMIGLGRMMLSYPDLASDVLAGRPLARKLFCRTFSDCTTGPRAGLISGCFPLDPYYKSHPAAKELKKIKSKN